MPHRSRGTSAASNGGRIVVFFAQRDDLFQTGQYAFALRLAHATKQGGYKCVELPRGRILHLFALFGCMDCNPPCVTSVATAANKTSLFQGVDCFAERCRAEVELSRKFGQGQTFIRNYVQGHELRRAQSRSLKTIEIRGLDDLAQLHPGGNESRCLLFQSRHFCIVYEPALHRGSA